MKILLVSASIDKKHRSNDKNSHYPIGMGYLEASIKKEKYGVKTLFLNDFSLKDCLNQIENNIKDANIVGFQILSFNRIATFRCIEYIEEKYPNKKIIIGGIHTSILYEQILKKYPKIIAILGEGERTIVNLLKNISNFSEIKGIAYNNGEKIVVNEREELIKDLDLLPFPSHDSFIDKYDKNRTLAGILTSRGCPFKCSFCCLDIISDNKVRFRSPENVVEEIEYIKNNFPYIQRIWIHDDSFTLNINRAIAICKLIIERKINLQFTCSARIKPFNKELTRWLEKAGFDHILFGLESGSERVLSQTNKKISKEDCVKMVELFVDSPITVTLFLIVGLPGESKETIQETIDFIQELQKIKYIYFDDVGVLMVYPGTHIYEICKSNNKLSDDYWIGNNEIPYFTVENSEEELFSLKDFLRKGISLTKITTKEGFEMQKDMIPYIQKTFPHIQNYIESLLVKN